MPRKNQVYFYATLGLLALMSLGYFVFQSYQQHAIFSEAEALLQKSQQLLLQKTEFTKNSSARLTELAQIKKTGFLGQQNRQEAAQLLKNIVKKSEGRWRTLKFAPSKIKKQGAQLDQAFEEVHTPFTLVISFTDQKDIEKCLDNFQAHFPAFFHITRMTMTQKKGRGPRTPSYYIQLQGNWISLRQG